LRHGVKAAVRAAGIVKPASRRTFRHSFVTLMAEAGHDIHTVRQLLRA